MQWRIPMLVLRIDEAFEAHEIANAELTAEHCGVMHRSTAFGIHCVHINTFFDKVRHAHGLIALGRNVEHIHAHPVSLVYVGPIFNKQSHK